MLPKTSTRKKADEDEGAKRNNALVLKSNLLILSWRINIRNMDSYNAQRANGIFRHDLDGNC
ncbi:hypothetical protein Q9233_002363 [Columba guinea]|nr:hypothetical protein Q9233_002363 [Columba guinea]